MNSMIIEQLKKANVIDSTGKVTLANLATYTLTHDILVVMYDGTVNNITGTYLRAVIEKWTFQDKAMGEQFITFDFLSEQPVAWAVNDYCIFRGERFVLNYIPSVTQKGRRNAVLDSYKYEGVKLNSLADELTRCQMLDVVLTSGQHDPDAGTNYTGSSQFQLFCGETTVNGVTRTAVMTLGDRILANLNRMYGENVWSIIYGDNTHTEDQQLSFDNQYVSEALAEVKNKFDLNYAVKGRTIYIGCELGDVAGVEYGFGPGYPTDEAGGKGLFELKKISDSSQQIVTRLRVLGSTKNLPYRYYNNAYPLPQALFPLNLQLPDTFLPEGSPSDPAGANTKWGHNKQRSSQLRAVKGATNDSYIDKNDDAAGTTEGIREATIRFDGSDSKLEEIYPTIENVTYDELRGSNVPDQDGNTGPGAYPNYESDEKVNEILAIGYKYDGQMFDDANIGSGILSENNGGQAGSIRDISIARRLDGIYTRVSDYFCGTEQILFTVAGQTAGRYFFTPVMSKEPYFFYSPASVKDRIGFIIRVKATSGGITTTIAEYKSDFYSGHNALALPSIPDVFYMMDAQVREIALSGTADITVTFIPCAKASTDILYGVGPKPNSSYTAQYVWNSVDHMDSSGMPFHFFVKDMGFDFAAQFNGETPTIVMKSGDCVGREFQIGQSIEKVEYQGKKGYMLTLNRASDSSLNTYYPNSRNQISADDQFVITGIDMPDAYIKAAEMRLLSAATEWLAENGNTNFHYQPTIDDFYLKRNYENMVKAGTPQDSVFWKIYAGYDLTFHPIPDNPSDPEPEAISVAIESVTITMGEGLTRKVDILLNDELKESTLKRVSREVKDLNNKIQRTGSGMSSATMETAIRTIGDNQYLSKVENDTAAGDITFNGNIRFNKNALFAQGAYFGENLDGSFNTEIDPLGNIHTARNVEAMWGVSAFGIANMAISGTGGGGTVTAVSVNGTRYTPSNGLITLPDYPSLNGYATENYVASYFDANFTQLNIKNTLGISDWALASTKPSYNFSEIGAKPSTLGGYGISDAHITNGEITLGQNTITPATLNNGKIPLSQIPDAILGQMLYGGTVNGSGVVTLSQNAKDKWGITSLTLTSTNYADYEGAFFIASANGSSGVPSSLGVLVGDWIIATSAGWGKIDNTDAVTGVKGNAESSYRIGNVNITPANIGLGNVENTALSTWVGTNNITTLGTITTGVWNGSAIGYNYLASGVQASLDKADTALQQESDPIFTASAAHGITSNDISTWNAKQNALAFDGTYDASTNKVATKSTVTNAINALDVSNISGFGAGKTLASLTETDGKIAATFQDISITKSQVSDFPTTWALADVTGADDLKAIEALTGTSGFLKKTAANTWSLDTDVASGTALSGVSTRVGTLEGYFNSGKLKSANIDLATGDDNGQVKIAGTNVSVKGWNTAATHAHGDYVTAVGIDATNGKLKWYLGGVAQNAPNIVAARLVDTNKTMFGNTYWTSSGIPASIGTATAPAALDYVTNIDSLLYFDKTNRKVEVGTSASPADLCSMGGVSAMGIANLSINSGGGQGTLTQIKVNGTAIADVNGVVNITATTGNANGKIAIAGQQIPVYGLGTLAYASSLSFDNLSSHPTTLGGYGITDAKIANGVITLGSNTITPITSLPTFYNLAFQNASGTQVDIYKPTTSPSKTIKAGSNVTISAASNVITIAATDTTYTFASGDNDGQIKVTPSGGTAQNIAVTGLDTAAFHAHGDYVTGLSWDSTNSKLAWSKGGSDQTAISIGYATNSGAVYNATLISSSSALDSFHEAKKMKYGVWSGFNTSILNSNGIVIDVGYSSAIYGAQILIDDDPTYVIGLRQKGANGWSDWKRIPMGDGTGASGTWNINVSGSAGSVAWANVTDHPTSLSQFTDDLGSSPTHTHSQYLTGNQTITLSGDVSGSGTTAITTSIGTGKVTNAMLAGSITNAKLSSLGKFTIGSTAIELGTTYTAANFRSYLGLGGAATYGATSSVTDGGTSLVTSGGVYSYVNALLTAAMKIEGETTTEISDGSTTNPVVIGGQSVSAYKGMVVFYGSKEFVWVGTAWKELGDESSFALKTTTVSGTGYLTGGGALSSNQTIDIASSVKTNIDNGATAYGWGNHADAGYVKAATDDTISGLKTFSHGIFVQGRVYNSGDDEGIVIKKANNGYAGVTLIKTTISGIHTTLYLDANDKARWVYNNGTTSYSIYHPEKNGTIALTTDIPTKLSDLTDDLGTSPTHTHSQYLPLSGGTMTGQLNLAGGTMLRFLDANNTERIIGHYVSKGDLSWYNGTAWGKVWHENNMGAGSGLNADLLDGYHASQMFIRGEHRYGLENLCTGVVKGRNTSVVDGKIVTTGTTSDTYFFVNTSENLVAGETYTFGFYVEGYTGTGTWVFRMSNNATCIPISINGNGWFWNTGKAIPDDGTASSQILINDAGSGNARALTFSKFIVVKGYAFPHYTPPISQMHVASADSATYSTTAGSAPASDVYAWAKEATKPSYNFGEIGAGDATIGEGRNSIKLRTEINWATSIYHHTNADECVVFLNKGKNVAGIENYTTSWIFAYGDPANRPAWNTLTPALQIKGNSVAINKLIESRQAASYNLDVNGTIGLSGQLTSTVADGTAPLVVASTTAVTNLNADLLDGHHYSELVTSVGIDATNGKLTWAKGGTAETAPDIVAAKLTTVSKTAWGQTFWTSGGIPASISGNMTNVGDITPSANDSKNIGSSSLQFIYIYGKTLATSSTNGLSYCASNGKHRWYASLSPDASYKQMELDANSNLTVQGDVMGMGGVSAMGIASMAINSMSGVSFASQIAMNGQTYNATSGLITLPNFTDAYNPSGTGSTTQALSQKGAKALYNAVIGSLPSTSTVAGWGFKKGMVYTAATASDSSIQVAMGADPTYQYITNTSQSSLVMTVTTDNAAANSYGVHRYIMIYNNRSSATLVQFADQGQGVVGPADSVSIPANSYMEFRIIHPASNAKCMVTWSTALKNIDTM